MLKAVATSHLDREIERASDAQPGALRSADRTVKASDAQLWCFLGVRQRDRERARERERE